jgi:hypothetical protein
MKKQIALVLATLLIAAPALADKAKDKVTDKSTKGHSSAASTHAPKAARAAIVRPPNDPKKLNPQPLPP